MELYRRWQELSVLKALKTRRIVLLNGARQCGKTTLAKKLISSEVSYRTLDDTSVREAALSDPRAFLKHSTNTLIIDEIQRAPHLLTELKRYVDEDTRFGQYLLTGSANINSLPNDKESLAGRVAKIRLRSLTQGEIKGVLPSFLENVLKGKLKEVYTEIPREDLLDLVLMGGMPEARQLENKDRRLWFKDYLEALIERDLKDISRIQHHSSMLDLIKVLASWSSKFMDVNAICSGLSSSRPTIESYINALEALYIVEKVSPWIKTDYERVGKTSKIFMTDSGLMASVLGWKKDDVIFDSDRFGKLLETFIFNELSAQIDTSYGEYSLFHYKDREQREIDFVIEGDDNTIIGIEVKSHSTVNRKDFKHINWFKENLVNDKIFVGVVLYNGTHTIQFSENTMAVPIGALWS